MSALARFSSFQAPPAAPMLRRSTRGRGLRLARRMGAVGVAVALLALLGVEAASLVPASRGVPGADSAAAAAWIPIRRPIALFDLAGSEFSKLPVTYQARRREADGTREDAMTFGQLGDGKPFLQLSLTRLGSPSEAADGDVSEALAKLAGLRGLSATRIRPAAPVETRLGSFETAEVLLWDGGEGRPCLGFRDDARGGSVLRVAGFACGAQGQPAGRAALACAIDRIDLVSAGDDAALRAVFVAAERRGGISCMGSTAPASLLGGSRRDGWLDPGESLPPLRGLFEAAAHQR